MTKTQIKLVKALAAKIEKKKEEIAKGRDELRDMFSDLEDLIYGSCGHRFFMDLPTDLQNTILNALAPGASIR